MILDFVFRICSCCDMESANHSVEVSVKFENKNGNHMEALPMSVLTNNLMRNNHSEEGDPMIQRDSCNSSGKSKTYISVRSSYLSVENHIQI